MKMKANKTRNELKVSDSNTYRLKKEKDVVRRFRITQKEFADYGKKFK